MRQLFQPLNSRRTGQRKDVIKVPLGSVVPAHTVGELAFDVLCELFEAASQHLLGFRLFTESFFP